MTPEINTKAMQIWLPCGSSKSNESSKVRTKYRPLSAGFTRVICYMILNSLSADSLYV